VHPRQRCLGFDRSWLLHCQKLGIQTTQKKEDAVRQSSVVQHCLQMTGGLGSCSSTPMRFQPGHCQTKWFQKSNFRKTESRSSALLIQTDFPPQKMQYLMVLTREECPPAVANQKGRVQCCFVGEHRTQNSESSHRTVLHMDS
jgi:hypothetical protein